MALKVDGGTARMRAQLARLGTADFSGLMEQGERVIVADNRRGVLAGQDRHGAPLAPLRSARKGPYKGASGPPLAPFGARSRTVANLVTGHGRDGNVWFAVGAWQDVLSAKGVPFLPFHFRGAGRLPVRDLAGVRPWGMALWRGVRQRWLHDLVRGRG